MKEVTINRDYLKELSYEVEQLSKAVHHNITKLNSEQSHHYFEVMRSVDWRVFFLDALGGIGKIFLMNPLLASIRMHKKLRFLSFHLE